MNFSDNDLGWSSNCPADHRGWMSAYFLQGILISLGNAVTVVVFWRRRSALKKASYLLINLAITDLFVGVGLMLLAVVDFCLKVPTVVVLVVRCSVFLGATASIWSLATIAVERAFAISKPLRHLPIHCWFYPWSLPHNDHRILLHSMAVPFDARGCRIEPEQSYDVSRAKHESCEDLICRHFPFSGRMAPISGDCVLCRG